MAYKVILQKSADKELGKISKGDKAGYLGVIAFLDRLKDEKQPQLLKNARKMQAYNDNRYRWRVGNYRVIGLIRDKELIIEIIKISTREGAYKGGEN